MATELFTLPIPNRTHNPLKQLFRMLNSIHTHTLAYIVVDTADAMIQTLFTESWFREPPIVSLRCVQRLEEAVRTVFVGLCHTQVRECVNVTVRIFSHRVIHHLLNYTLHQSLSTIQLWWNIKNHTASSNTNSGTTHPAMASPHTSTFLNLETYSPLSILGLGIKHLRIRLLLTHFTPSTSISKHKQHAIPVAFLWKEVQPVFEDSIELYPTADDVMEASTILSLFCAFLIAGNQFEIVDSFVLAMRTYIETHHPDNVTINALCSSLMRAGIPQTLMDTLRKLYQPTTATNDRYSSYRFTYTPRFMSVDEILSLQHHRYHCYIVIESIQGLETADEEPIALSTAPPTSQPLPFTRPFIQLTLLYAKDATNVLALHMDDQAAKDDRCKEVKRFSTSTSTTNDEESKHSCTWYKVLDITPYMRTSNSFQVELCSSGIFSATHRRIATSPTLSLHILRDQVLTS
uniref:F-actin-capping protein subunit alpha-1 n=1 Tax=Lygus hesperus TaxID=30085 RepID=A0A0A9XHU9_LYGHE